MTLEVLVQKVVMWPGKSLCRRLLCDLGSHCAEGCNVTWEVIVQKDVV